MKRIVLAGLTFGLLSGQALADAFTGSLYVSKVSAACGGFPAIGNIIGMRYLPRNLGTNGDTTILTVNRGTDRFAFMISFRADGINLIGNAYHPVDGNAIFESHGSFASQMRITSHVPNAPTTATKSIALRGNVRDFNGVANCEVAFQATGYDYP